MAHLTLAGVSDDGKRLRLTDDDGVEHTLDLDERLRAALRGDATRRLETKMDSALRPRDIQARIRAGETPEAVAEAAQTSVEKIMAFAAHGHRTLLHGFEQGRLRFGRRTVNFVGEHDVGEDRAAHEFEMAVLVEDFRTRDVGRHQVGRKLYTFEIKVEHFRYRAD